MISPHKFQYLTMRNLDGSKINSDWCSYGEPGVTSADGFCGQGEEAPVHASKRNTSFWDYVKIGVVRAIVGRKQADIYVKNMRNKF